MGFLRCLVGGVLRGDRRHTEQEGRERRPCGTESGAHGLVSSGDVRTSGTAALSAARQAREAFYRDHRYSDGLQDNLQVLQNGEVVGITAGHGASAT